MLMNTVNNPVALTSAQIAVFAPLLKMVSEAVKTGWYPNPQHLFSAAQPASNDATSVQDEIPLNILVHLLYQLCTSTHSGNVVSRRFTVYIMCVC